MGWRAIASVNSPYCCVRNYLTTVYQLRPMPRLSLEAFNRQPPAAARKLPSLLQVSSHALLNLIVRQWPHATIAQILDRVCAAQPDSESGVNGVSQARVTNSVRTMFSFGIKKHSFLKNA